MQLIDIHAHLESNKFESDLDEVIDRSRNEGVKYIINSGVNPSTNRISKELSEKYDLVLSSFGIYPIDAIADKLQDFGEEGYLRHVERFDVEDELKWIEENKDSCVAIGEVGLDYKIVKGFENEQIEVFEKVLDLAKKIDKPIIIHSRGAEEKAIEILEKKEMRQVIMHCFNGRKSLIKRCVENGWYLSVPPVITRLQHFTTLVEIVPLGQLLTETDAPYLSSVQGKRNEPIEVRITIKEIAKIKGLSEEEVGKIVFENAKNLFKLN